jgi:hypothetical protein
MFIHFYEGIKVDVSKVTMVETAIKYIIFITYLLLLLLII